MNYVDSLVSREGMRDSVALHIHENKPPQKDAVVDYLWLGMFTVRNRCVVE